MNPGAIEEVGKVATGVIDSLKTQPMAIALVLMNFALLAYMFYEAKHFNEMRQETTKIFLAQASEVNQLLAKCVVPNK